MADGSAGARGVLIIVENLTVPLDRRVWTEATTLRDAGYDVSIICPVGPGHEARREELEGIHVHRHPLPPEGGSALGYVREYLVALWHEFRLAREVVRERRIDIVQICNPPDLLFLVALVLKLLHGARIVFDHHDVNPELYEEKYGRRDLFYHLLVVAERLTFAVADVVISTNASYERVAIERGRKRPDRVFVVRSSPDPARFRPVPPPSGLKGEGTCLVGYVGIMAPQDGVGTLIEAAAHIVHRLGRRDIRFELIGGGPSLEELRRMARSLAVEDFVRFAGYLGGETLLGHLSGCDVCVSPDPPTAYNTMCTMNKTLEYMALGKPVVQFDLVEGRVSAGDAAAYVVPATAEALAAEIVALADDPERRACMGMAGLRRIQTTLGWPTQVANLLAAYESAALRTNVPRTPAL